MIKIPLSTLTCAVCGKQLEAAEDKSGLKDNQVRCANCGSIITIHAVGSGKYGREYFSKDGMQWGYISPFSGGSGGSGRSETK